MSGGSQIGVTGLAVMGANLARNIASRDVPVAVHNRSPERTREFMDQYGGEGQFTPGQSLEEFVDSLDKPRRIIVLVKAGAPVDGVIEALEPLLDDGDIVIDGGNSRFLDTRRRTEECRERGLRFIGTGVSGGEEGALHGPSIMPGGERDAYGEIEDIFTTIAAQVDGVPCCAYIGPDGAGHYVKMVHNGIEYADMQLIAEAYDLLRHGAGMSVGELSKVFEQWNEGDLDSFLIDITAKVLAKEDPDSGKPLIDVIVDQAEQKGTGRWTAQDALEQGVPLTAITEAVFARGLSALRDERAAASKTLAGPTSSGESADGLVDDVRQALYASKVVAYAQGFEQMTAASKVYDWNLDMGSLATIWRGGCIIQARFLDRIKEAYENEEAAANLLVMPYFRDAVADAQDSWRRVISKSVELGIPVPAFSSSLAYYDGYRRERGPANLIQGLRDYFGAHTYRRVDREGSYHTRWGQDGSEVRTDG
jgi:6-phosphogluconate dehydrogenase